MQAMESQQRILSPEASMKRSVFRKCHSVGDKLEEIKMRLGRLVGRQSP